MPEKKRVYLFQPTYMSADSVNLPYGIGALASYAWRFPDIAAAYELTGIFVLREKTDDVLSRIGAPFLAGFSCFMWNMEYNKALAEKLKRRYPACTVVFGGPQIPADASVLEECPFVDVLIHNEGEVPFLRLLRALADGSPLSGVDSVSFRAEDGPRTTPLVTAKEFDFPSPFGSGFYDRLLSEHPEIEFVPVIETNRGCPNRCAYCSWATSDAPVRLFPLERVYADLEWVAAHKMEFLGVADANFGMFPRDERIVDYLIALHGRTGYPKKFQVSYAKDAPDRVFRITEKLNRAGLCKAVTLSFQTLSETAQANIGRTNISVDAYRDMLRRYTAAGIPTYTELILGMPGETKESFFNGIEELLEKGQHASLLVHLCEWLPLSGMGKKAYLEKYGISYTKIPLNQPHAQISAEEELPEFSRVITATASMPQADWKRCALFSAAVSCFHHLGLMQLPALYLYVRGALRGFLRSAALVSARSGGGGLPRAAAAAGRSDRKARLRRLLRSPFRGRGVELRGVRVSLYRLRKRAVLRYDGPVPRFLRAPAVAAARAARLPVVYHPYRGQAGGALLRRVRLEAVSRLADPERGLPAGGETRRIPRGGPRRLYRLADLRQRGRLVRSPGREIPLYV